MKKSAKILTAVLALALVAALSIGGTAAWLTAETNKVENVFTMGDIGLKLEESEDLDLKVVPGKVITKDPKVTVTGGSEACWLFLTVKADNWMNELAYTIASGWLPLSKGVYYREVSMSELDQVFHILGSDQVLVSDDLTKEAMDAARENPPKLTFQCFAVQRAEFDKPLDAWNAIKPAK